MVVPGTARASARGLVVVVPDEEATYVLEYSVVEPPTEMVDAVKAAVAVRVSPDKVIVAVGPRDQAAPPLLTVSVILPAVTAPTAFEVTRVPRLLEPVKYIASGVPEKGRPVMSKVEEMVLAAPAELTAMVTVRQAALVWQVSDTVTAVT